MLLGHAHAHGQAGFLAEELECGVVVRAAQAWRPVLVNGRVAAQRGHDGIGHGNRTEHGGLQLGEHGEARRPALVGRGLAWCGAEVVDPGTAVQASLHGRVHQGVVAGVELHLVDAVAKAVVAAQLGRVHIGQLCVGLHLCAAQARTQYVQTRRV